MKEETILQYVGKKAKVFLKNMPRHYTADILSLDNGTVIICDKFGKTIPIDCDMIGLMEIVNDDDVVNESGGGRFG